MQSLFINTISRFAEQKHLFSDGGRYIVALSGGADSVALLLTMLQLGHNMKIEAAHCNFHLRREESNRDEKFCVNLCKHHGIELHRAHFDTTSYASLHHISIEMAARELRYNYFFQLLHSINADGICVAHHKDDSIETFLINLLRGTGINGLCGIKAKNGKILRPLLCVGRQEILDFLNEEKQSYVTDSTNLVPDVLRNKVRLRLLPLMEEIAPAARKQILSAASRLDEIRKVLTESIQQQAEYVKKDEHIDMKALRLQPSPQLLLHSLIAPYGFNSSQTDEILASQATDKSRRWTSITHEAVLIGNDLSIEEKIDIPSIKMSIPIDGLYNLPDGRHLKITMIDRESLNEVPHEPWRVAIDASKICFPLILRNPHEGDSFCPYGMNGKKKLVGRFLTDLKLTHRERRHTLLLTSNNDEILWVAGHRIAQNVAIVGSTRRIALIEITGR